MLNSGQGLPALTSAHDQSKARFASTSKAMKLTKYSAGVMGGLLKQGDTITPEDVIGVAGKMVAQGAPAVQMASTLASMPTEPGEALMGWVQQKAQGLAQVAQQMAQAHEAARHGMATDALREIVGHTVDGHIQQQGGPQAADGGAGAPPDGGASPSPPPGPAGLGAPPPPPAQG